MERDEENSSSFSTGNSAQERGLSYVPQCYVVPTMHRPSLALKDAGVPVIDMAELRNGSAAKSRVIQEIKEACSRLGFFQVSFFVL